MCLQLGEKFDKHPWISTVYISGHASTGTWAAKPRSRILRAVGTTSRLSIVLANLLLRP